jgi:hypothetical protein
VHWTLTLLLVALVGAAAGSSAVFLLMVEALRYERAKARRCGQAHLAMSARHFELNRLYERKRQRNDKLVSRLSLVQRDIEAMKEASTAVAMAAQLDALWKRADWHDSQPMPLDD